MNRVRIWVLRSMAATFIACSPAPMPIAASPVDPSNPDAPEGVAPESLYTRPPEAHPAGHGAGGGSEAPHEGHTVYACPMHPEVTAMKAGVTCPKCNMTLVPRK